MPIAKRAVKTTGVVSRVRGEPNRSKPPLRLDWNETEPLLRRILGIEVSPVPRLGWVWHHSNSWRSRTPPVSQVLYLRHSCKTEQCVEKNKANTLANRFPGLGDSRISKVDYVQHLTLWIEVLEEDVSDFSSSWKIYQCMGPVSILGRTLGLPRQFRKSCGFSGEIGVI